MTKENSSTDLDGAPCSAIVQISQHGGPPENASRLVWWLARLALKQMGRQPVPKLGDSVVEVTHLMGLARKQLGLLSAVGKLVGVEQDEHQGTIYTILTIEGKYQRWENANVVTVESEP
jgi:hypothetical protein